MNTFKAKMVSVITGDVIVLDIELPFNIKYVTRVRLKDIRCPEARNVSDPVAHKAAVECVAFVHTLLMVTQELTVTISDYTPGRVLGVINLGLDKTLNSVLVDEGYATAFDK